MNDIITLIVKYRLFTHYIFQTPNTNQKPQAKSIVMDLSLISNECISVAEIHIPLTCNQFGAFNCHLSKWTDIYQTPWFQIKGIAICSVAHCQGRFASSSVLRLQKLPTLSTLYHRYSDSQLLVWQPHSDGKRNSLSRCPTQTRMCHFL